MAAKKKVVLLLGLHENDAKEKRKVLKAVSTFPGLDLIAVDMKERKLTVVGLVDPLELVTKLRKLWHADILFVGPATAKDDKKEGGAAASADADAADGVKEEYYQQEVVATTAAKQAERRPVDMRSWPPHAAAPAAVHVYPARPRYPPYPYVPPPPTTHQQHGAQETNPHGSYYVVAYGHGGAQEGHPNHPYVVAQGRHGARENRPQNYYGPHEGPPNGCAIC